MKWFVILFLMMTTVYAGEPVPLDDRYSKSQKCMKCHFHIVRQWKESWHAKSHYENDEYFQKSIDYMTHKVRGKSLDTLQVLCARCHNPRIMITETTAEDELAAKLELETHKPIHNAVTSKKLNEGINCAVCHNIDKIHKSNDPAKRGIDLLEWLPAGKMSGPFDDAKSPYHTTYQRDFMVNKTNDLCLVCHANQRSYRDFVFSDTEKEYKAQKNPKLCVDCHMSEKKPGKAAMTSKKKRMVRSHGFQGAHTPDLLKGALNLSLKQEKDTLLIQLDNPNPHNVPTGYGGREIVIDIAFFNGGKAKNKSISLTTHYLSKRKKPTIPELAVKATEDMSVPAMGKRVQKVAIPAGAQRAEVIVSYRLVNEEIIGILELKDPIWSKKTFVATEDIYFK